MVSPSRAVKKPPVSRVDIYFIINEVNEMTWLDIEEMKRIIFEQRKKEFNDINNKNVKENIQLALIKSKDLKENCLKNIKYSFSTQNIMEIMPLLLKTEAEILAINAVVIYANFTDGWTLETYLERELQYAYVDYITNIEYFSQAYKTICFLPFFCSETFSNEETRLER